MNEPDEVVEVEACVAVDAGVDGESCVEAVKIKGCVTVDAGVDGGSCVGVRRITNLSISPSFVFGNFLGGILESE